MKTPEEIKKALACTGSKRSKCVRCAYWPDNCAERSERDALDYIVQLENGIDHAEKVAKEAAKSIAENLDKLQSRLARVERERDAAVRELEIAEDCYNCKYNYACKHDGNGYRKCSECGECPCSECNSGKSQYEWRGVCEENTK